jgi:hypothetical protein
MPTVLVIEALAHCIQALATVLPRVVIIMLLTINTTRSNGDQSMYQSWLIKPHIFSEAWEGTS